MRILHVITRFLKGGAEEKTLAELAHLRHEQDFVLATGPEIDPAALAPLEGWGIPHHVIPALRHYAPWAAPSAVGQLRRLIRRHGFDLVHTHSTEAGLLGREAAHREGTPRIVHTIHGLEFSTAHPLVIRHAVRAFHRHLAPFTDRYFSNADRLTEAFVAARIGAADQYALVPSGIDVEKAAQQPETPLEGSGPHLLTAGRLARGKGMEDVVAAFSLVAPQWPSASLWVAGDGPQRRALEAQARRASLAERVRFLGHRTDLAGLMKAADAFVFASHREGTPRVVTLAMAAGCPIVSTDVDGIPEQVRHGREALLVPPRSPRRLAEAILQTMIAPEEARARADAARRRASLFSVEAMVAALRKEYARLAEGIPKAS